MRGKIESAKELQRVKDSGPTKADAVALFGQEKLTESPDGRWTLDINKGVTDVATRKKNIQKLLEITTPRRRLEIQRSGRRNGLVSSVPMRAPDGRIIATPEHSVEARELQGFRRVRGQRGTLYFTDKAGRRWKRPKGRDWELDTEELEDRRPLRTAAEIAEARWA